MEAIRTGRFPAWALFCFKDLVSDARKGYKPEIVALTAEDAILLHPVTTPSGIKGLLIAQESASERVVTFTDDYGEEIELLLPFIPTKVVANEDITLHLSS